MQVSPPSTPHPATWNWVIGDIIRKFILVGSAIAITIPWQLRPTLVTMVTIYKLQKGRNILRDLFISLVRTKQ